jgi:peptide-methionine (R)-S-oxide reductase
MTRKIMNMMNRRNFFTSTGAAALSLGAASSVKASTPLSDEMVYEVTRETGEWFDMLTNAEFGILRLGKTEARKSSPLWLEEAEGTYHCKGCDLKSFDSNWKVILDKGWVFFYHAVPDAVLMSIDTAVPEYGVMTEDGKSITEVHCRRCGSHLGHFLKIEGTQTHCINGSALNFKPAAT